MKIDQNTTVRDFERFNGSEIEMSLTRSTAFNPTVLASLTHFLVGQLRKQKSIKITLDVDITEIKNVLNEHYNYFHILSIVLFNNNVSIVDNKEREIPHDKLRYGFKKGRQIQEYAYTQNPGKRLPQNSPISQKDLTKYRSHLGGKGKQTHDGICLGLSCFDHLKQEGLDNTAYLNPGGHSKSWQDISVWVERFFSLNDLKTTNVLSRADTVEDVSILIYELFDNTNEWARTTYNHETNYSPNFRSCLINVFLKERLRSGVSAYEEIVNGYLKELTNSDKGALGIPNLQASLFDQDDLGVLEISISDTGPGMARRFLQKDYTDMTESEQINAVIRCFQKYLTSDTSGTRQVRGRGLSKVVSVIGRTGLIRVRSGNVEVARNFLNTPLKKNELKEGIKFDSKKYLNLIEGTCISILYPFKYKY